MQHVYTAKSAGSPLQPKSLYHGNIWFEPKDKDYNYLKRVLILVITIIIIYFSNAQLIKRNELYALDLVLFWSLQ